MVSARGDKKIISNNSEYNTIKSTREYNSKEEEIIEDEEIEDMCWLDNSIKNLNVRMNKT